MVRPALGYTGERKDFPHGYAILTRIQEALPTPLPNTWDVHVLWDVFKDGRLVAVATGAQMAEDYVTSHSPLTTPES